MTFAICLDWTSAHATQQDAKLIASANSHARWYSALSASFDPRSICNCCMAYIDNSPHSLPPSCWSLAATTAMQSSACTAITLASPHTSSVLTILAFLHSARSSGSMTASAPGAVLKRTASAMTAFTSAHRAAGCPGLSAYCASRTCTKSGQSSSCDAAMCGYELRMRRVPMACGGSGVKRRPRSSSSSSSSRWWWSDTMLARRACKCCAKLALTRKSGSVGIQRLMWTWR